MLGKLFILALGEENVNAVQSLILTRTSYRGIYSDTPVSRKDLKTIMEMGLCAPSGCNKQTTSLIAVDDVTTLNEIKRCITPPIFETAPRNTKYASNDKSTWL